MDLDYKLEQARKIVEEAYKTYKPKNVFGLYSGGHDSSSVTHFAAESFGDRLTGVVHINTGIGIPETRQHVYKVAKKFGWNLLEYKAVENTRADGTPDPMVYEDLVLKHGFPGAYGHGMMYQRLKERQINRLARDYGAKPKEPIMLVSGCRKEESSRRMGTTKEIDPRGRIIWIAPFAYMTALECSEYLKQNEIPRNPVKDYLHMSGECLCGAFAHKGELSEIEMWYPETAKRIKDIQKKVIEAGFPWGWEDQPPKWWSDKLRNQKSGQADAFADELDQEIESVKEMLCTACHKNYEDSLT